MSPFPHGTPLPDGDATARFLAEIDGSFWIHATKCKRRALLMTPQFAASAGIAQADGTVERFQFSNSDYLCVCQEGLLDVVDKLPRPANDAQAIAFAAALSDVEEPISGLIYIEGLGRLVPYTAESAEPRSKAEVLGAYLTGGIEVSADDIVLLSRILPKVDPEDLHAFAARAGIAVKSPSIRPATKGGAKSAAKSRPDGEPIGRFELPGRQALTDFFNEHIVDIVADEERYAALGIGFPGSVILEGPTGCGKTFAVERLIEHLGWPSFQIEASTIASPYIHETSRKVAEVFAEAIKAAPSVIVIDEMDAFLSSRDSGAHQHQVEEIAEFLRRIPEASKNRVLIIGMTNQIKAIDPAILRRGRFDHVIHVPHAGRDEIAGMLEALLAEIPHELADLGELAGKLSGRPLSDVAFVIREAGRLTARAKKDMIGPAEFEAAVKICLSRDEAKQRKIGF